MTEVELKEEIAGAIARGWCSKINEHKEFDADLAGSIVEEVWAEVSAFLLDHVHIR